jgi:hypothetical protein
MSNWCECELFISGPKEELEKFLETVKSEESVFDFIRIIPYPEPFRERECTLVEWMKKSPDEKTGELPRDSYNEYCDYAWYVLNWGTRWNARRAKLCEQTETWEKDGRKMLRVELNFDTAWSPPKPIIERASEHFPELAFDLRYFKCGRGGNGQVICERGEVIEDQEGPYFEVRGG